MNKQTRAQIEEICFCPCGRTFVDADDYDTLGSESGVCCPDCGSEEFRSIKDFQIEVLRKAQKSIYDRRRYLADNVRISVPISELMGLREAELIITRRTKKLKGK